MLKRLLTIAATVTLFCAFSVLVPAPASAAGWAVVSSWNGGRTLACASPNGDGTSTVNTYWNGRDYPANDMGDATTRGAGGLAHVNGRFAISGWTYSAAARGEVGRVTSLVRPDNGWVYFISGSTYGIMVEVVMPVAAVPLCPDGRTAAAQPVPQRVAAPAGGPCVTNREFRRLRKGMTVRKVRTVVGARGKQVTAADYSIVRRYQRCSGGTIVVNFKKKTRAKPLALASRYRR
jgi:hypothetical protein